jgi:hypothetical protein
MISLWQKVCNFNSKNSLKTPISNKELCSTGSFQHSQGACLTRKVQLCHLEGYCEPMSEGKLVIFPWLAIASSISFVVDRCLS